MAQIGVLCAGLAGLLPHRIVIVQRGGCVVNIVLVDKTTALGHVHTGIAQAVLLDQGPPAAVEYMVVVAFQGDIVFCLTIGAFVQVPVTKETGVAVGCADL